MFEISGVFFEQQLCQSGYLIKKQLLNSYPKLKKSLDEILDKFSSMIQKLKRRIMESKLKRGDLDKKAHFIQYLKIHVPSHYLKKTIFNFVCLFAIRISKVAELKIDDILKLFKVAFYDQFQARLHFSVNMFFRAVTFYNPHLSFETPKLTLRLTFCVLWVKKNKWKRDILRKNRRTEW